MSWLVGALGFFFWGLVIASVISGETHLGSTIAYYLGLVFIAIWAKSLAEYQAETLDALKKQGDKPVVLAEEGFREIAEDFYDEFLARAHKIWGDELPPNVAQDLLDYKRAIDGRAATYGE